MKRPLLLPLVPLYAAGLALRELRLQRGWEPVRRLRDPVISIGNLSVGGSGKTPLTIALARLLTAKRFQVDVLSRGYGRTGLEPMRVAPTGSAAQYGDEPLLIARSAGVPVYVAQERFVAGRLAEGDSSVDEKGRRVHILDDGFQHRQLARDIDILLMNREDWHDHLLPTGNLREELRATKRANVIAIPANDAAFETQLRAWDWSGPVWRVRRRMEVPQVVGPVVAFCGIARPEQFFEGLRANGIALAAIHAFPDHHRYTARDIERVLSSARTGRAAALITTEKDAVRLEALGAAIPATPPLEVARLSIEFEDEGTILSWIEERIGSTVAAQHPFSAG